MGREIAGAVVPTVAVRDERELMHLSLVDPPCLVRTGPRLTGERVSPKGLTSTFRPFLTHPLRIVELMPSRVVDSSRFLELLFPRRCGVCRLVGGSPCWACQASLIEEPPRPKVPPGCRSITAAFDYVGPIRRLVRSVKYGSHPVALSFLARRMTEELERELVMIRADVVTWVPTSPARRRRRGFDQAEILAGHVGLLLGLPVRGLLEHVPQSGSQTGRSRSERLDSARRVMFVPIDTDTVRHSIEPEQGPDRADQANPADAVGPAYSVLLVDDVVTTGATLSSAARVLRENGARSVIALVAAATP
jgi:predicted amidophosphoribosyltransferase